MTNKEVLKKVKNNIHRGSTYALFKGNRPPGRVQEKLLNKYKVPVDVDPEIRKIVIELNEKGFKTIGSCAGHRPNKRRGFVTIDKPLKYANTILIRRIFKKYGIDKVYITEKNWPGFWFAVEFMSVGKDIKLLK